MDWQSKFETDPPYQLVESSDFTQQVQELIRDFRYWDELKSDFDIYLPRDPDVFSLVPDTELLLFSLTKEPFPTIYFSINHRTRQIILEEIHLLEDDTF